MNKSELLNMTELTATRKMLTTAKEDKPEVETYKSCNGDIYERKSMKYWLYIRGAVQNNILKISCFLAEPLRERCKDPAYEIYIDRNNNTYLTYKPQDKKWLTACYERLDWPSYKYCSRRVMADRSTVKLMNEYFNTSFDKENILSSLLKFQAHVMKRRLEAKHKKQTDPWDEDLKQTRSLPKDWGHWVDKVGIPEQYVFYRYTRTKYKNGYCTYCEHDVKVQPHHNEIGICPNCHHKVMFKALGKFSYHNTERYPVYLMQKCKDGFMIREFYARRHCVSSKYRESEVIFFEQRRVICNENGILDRAYYYGLYKNCNYRWIRTGTCSPYWDGNDQGKIYGKSFACLNKTCLKKTGLAEMYKLQNIIDPEYFLSVYERIPYIERMIKARLVRLSQEYLHKLSNHYWSGNDKVQIDPDQTSLTKMLFLTQSKLKRLRNLNGGVKMLIWLQYETNAKIEIPDNTLQWLISSNISPEELKFATVHMSIPQIHHYIVKQMNENNMKPQDVLTTWKDYLSMAHRLGYDTNSEIVYRVRKLKLRHGQLVDILQKQDMNMRACEIADDFPNVEENLHKIKTIYSYGDDEYTVLVPDKIEDVLTEGRNLHHCVADQERYWDRIDRNESYIFFLRKTNEIERSYYTLEVEPGGTVRQKRTMYDNQEKDIEEATDFLRKWQSVIRTRLREEDKKLAEKSKILRLQNFEQLRRDNVKINTGKLQGQSLVDILMADLMVA